MLKNSKFLKGLTLVLALVLVLGAGVLVGTYVEAATKTVLFYVSDNGDNTTGEDEATAFTSIDAAIAAANKMYLEPGSQLKLLVVDRISVPTQKVDGEVLTDRTGARVPIIITSHQNVTDKEDFSEVYFTYFTEDPDLPEDSQKAVIYNDVTFKNIRLNSQAQDVFSDAGDSEGFYCVRFLYFNGEKLTLDNVELSNEDSLGKAKWNLYPGGDTATEEYLNKEINFLNGDYKSKTTVTYVTNANNPNTNYVFNVENALLNYVYVVGGNANQVTVNLKDGADIRSLYYGTGGKKSVPQGVTINYEKGSVVRGSAGSSEKAEYTFDLTQNVYGTLSSAKKLGPAGDINGDMILNFYEGCSVTGAVTLGDYGGVTGTVLTNVYGGTFNSAFALSKAEVTTTASLSNKINRLVTNVYGGTFKSKANFAPNIAETSAGEVITTLGEATFSGDVAVGGIGRIDGDLQLYINGTTFKGCLRAAYGSSSVKSGIGGDVYVKVTDMDLSVSKKYFRFAQNMGVIEGNTTIIFDTTGSSSNSINLVAADLSFGTPSMAANDALVYADGGANKSIHITSYTGGAGEKRVINNLKNCVVETFAGMRDTGTEYLENNLENVDITNYYGAVTNKALSGTFGAIVNSLKNCTVKTLYYGGSGGSAATVVGSVTNIMEGTTTTAGTCVMGAGAQGHNIDGDITNYFKDTTLGAVTYCGSTKGTVAGNINTTFIGGSQKNTFYGGNSAGGTVEGNITNIFDSVEFVKGVGAGNLKGTLKGDVSTTFTNCTTGSNINACVSADATFGGGAIKLTINGGTYTGNINANTADAKMRSVDVTINGGTFNGSIALLSNSGIEMVVEEDVRFTVTSAVFNPPTSGDKHFRIFRPYSTGSFTVKGDVVATFDTTGDPSNKIVSGFGNFEVSMGFSNCNFEGETILNVDGGSNSAIEFTGLTGAMSTKTAINNVKNCKLGAYRGGRDNASTPAGSTVNNFENVVITDFYSGASTNNTALSVIYNGTVTNNLKNVSVGGVYFGGAADTKASSMVNIVNNITDCSFGSTFYGGGDGEITGSIITNIYGAEFKGAVKASYTTPVGQEVQLNLNPTAAPIKFTGTVAAAAATEKVSLKGAEYPIHLTSAASLTLDSYDGAAQKFVQDEAWTVDQTYVTFPAGSELKNVITFNGGESVTGIGVVDGLVIRGAQGVVGSVTAPELKSASFHLADALGVRFWLDKAEIASYIEAYGSWGYSVDFMGNQIQSKTYTSVDQFAEEDLRENGAYVTFPVDLEFTSTMYGETITVALSGGVSSDYTVYSILDMGISYYETSDPEFALLMKAIYNYGAEAYNVLKNGNVDVKYASQVPAPQQYTGSASANGSAGYNFYGTGISLAEKVTLNYYLKLDDIASLANLSFAASSAKGALSAEAIRVEEVNGVAEYNVLVSLELTVPQMAETYTLTVQAGGATVASCTNSVIYSCMAYINPQGTPTIYAPVAKALLSFIEASLPISAR